MTHLMNIQGLGRPQPMEKGLRLNKLALGEDVSGCTRLWICIYTYSKKHHATEHHWNTRNKTITKHVKKQLTAHTIVRISCFTWQVTKTVQQCIDNRTHDAASLRSPSKNQKP